METENFDIVIIGAGLGGLVSACLLAKEGYKVCVLEKNIQTGGCLQNFGLDGNRFESAVHYIGSLARDQTLYKIFSYLGIMDDLSLQRLDADCFDEIILHHRSYKLAQGYDTFVEGLSSAFPGNHADLCGYAEALKHVCRHFPLYDLRLGDPAEKEKVSQGSLREKMESITDNPLLQQVLTGNNLLYGGTFEQTPFYQHALIENSYIEGSWKCKEGSSQIAKLLQREIQKHGGTVRRHCEVMQLVELNGLIQYVITQSGERYYGRHFISNLHPRESFRLLDSELIRPATIRRINSLEQTPSAFMVNLSLRPGTIPYVNHNIYYHQGADVWQDVKHTEQKLPSSYGIYFTEDASNPGYACAISILTYMQQSQWNDWAKTCHTTSFKGGRDEDYQLKKKQHIAYITEQAATIIPGLKHAVRVSDACTPLTYRDYLHYPLGAMYGNRRISDQLSASTMSTRTRIPNFFLTGQNINLHGVLGVAITAVLTAAELTGLEYLIHKIKSA